MTRGTKVWLTGATGMLGHAFRDLFERHGLAFASSDHNLDVADRARLLAFAAHERPSHIMNCAAYTRVDDAEIDEASAFAVNAAGAENVAHAARLADATLVHFSTDYVFAGTSAGTVDEDARCEPLNAYGRSKLEGECRVLEALADRAAGVGPRVYIIRTSWLFGEHGDNFVRTMLRRMHDSEPVRVVADQHGRPTYAADLAHAALALAAIVPTSSRGPDGRERAPSGIYHFANAGQTTWHGLAVEILHQGRAMGWDLKTSAVEAISSAELPRRAKRPAFSVLATDRITSVLGTPPRPWQTALSDYLRSFGVERESR